MRVAALLVGGKSSSRHISLQAEAKRGSRAFLSREELMPGLPGIKGKKALGARVSEGYAAVCGPRSAEDEALDHPRKRQESLSFPFFPRAP